MTPGGAGQSCALLPSAQKGIAVSATTLIKTADALPVQPIRIPRAPEYDIFAQVTRRLTQAGTRSDVVALATAVHDNRCLWTRLTAEVSRPGNPLPAPLRARLFYLAEFTRMHSRKVLLGEARADVLVEINTAVLKGLRKEGAQG